MVGQALGGLLARLLPTPEVSVRRRDSAHTIRRQARNKSSIKAAATVYSFRRASTIHRLKPSQVRPVFHGYSLFPSTGTTTRP